jgi:curved DNA-binding protein CbpA
MPTKEELSAWVKVALTKSYYDILRINKKAEAADVKKAFHRFALLVHPDQFADQDADVREAAAEAFKRGVEAYRVLGDEALRKRYDRALASGKIRIDPNAIEEKPAGPKVRTLEDSAKTARGKELARRADRQLVIRDFDQARVLLASAIQEEPYNEELSARMRDIYDLMAR